MQIKINQKNYEVSNNWNFKEFNKLNASLIQEDISFFQVMKTHDVFMFATCMVMLATGQSYEEATETMNQHVEGGGDFSELSTAFAKGIQSDFFQKMMGKVEKEIPQEKTQQQHQNQYQKKN